MKQWILKACLLLMVLLFLFATVSCATNNSANAEKSATKQNSEEQIKEDPLGKLGERSNGWIILLDHEGNYLFKSRAVSFSESADGAGPEYVEWYDLEGNFYQWNGTYIYSSKNINYGTNMSLPRLN